MAKAALESLLIVFSVVLALAVDSCREDRARHRQIAEARDALVQELRLNRRILADEAHLPHHRRLQKVYNDMQRDARVDRARALFETGVHVPPLRNAAWQTFLTSGVASEIPFSVRATLAGIYAQQANVHQLLDRLLASLMTPTIDRANPAYTRDLVQVIDMTLTDLVYAEADLLKQYDQASALLTGAGGR